MRKIKNGIERIEREMGATKSCGTCGGGGWAGIVLVSPSGKFGKPKLGCPECKKVSRGVRGCKAYGSGCEDVETLPDWMAVV